MLSPTIFFAVVVGTISAFQAFGQIDLLTQGRTARQDERAHVLDLHDVLRSGGTRARPRCSSIALFVITLVLTLIQLRFLERRVHYAR